MRRKTTAIILTAVITISALSGCTKRDVKEETESYTSDSLGLYVAKNVVGNTMVVDSYGNEMKNYDIDGSGNIINSSQVLIEQENVKEYKYVNAIISLNDTVSDSVTLPRRIKTGTIDEFETSPTLYEYKVYVSPAEANHCEVKVSSSNTEIAELLQSNSGIVNADGSAIFSPIEGVATIYIQCKSAGNVKFTISSTDSSNKSAAFELNIYEAEYNDANIEKEDPIQTTENSIGYVQGTNVRFRSEPNADAEIIAFYNTGKQLTLLGSDINSGWSKCVIDANTGYVKSEFVTRTQPSINPNNQNNIYIVNTPTPISTPMPTATSAIAPNDGNDHGLATGAQTENAINEQERRAQDKSHTHYYVKVEVVAPSTSERGYTLYRCDCGASYKTNYKTK